jgi:imidazolonepropionase-like amidohydrolase
MTRLVLENATIVDAADAQPRDGMSIVVEGNIIREVTPEPVRSGEGRRIDLRGKTVLPGLIDCHNHIFLSEVYTRRLEAVPLTLMTARAVATLSETLDRGFTTLRDAGGADWGIRLAVEQRLVRGPRLFISGQAISQTGGHGDTRLRTEIEPDGPFQSALRFGKIIADGVDEVIKATRIQLRCGADQVKIMVSGGVASLNDPIDVCQYTPEEIQAICREARTWKTYVMAHAYTPEAIVHAVANGVRTVEHANLIDRTAAAFVRENDAYVVPTLITYDALNRRGAELGMAAASLKKLGRVLEDGVGSLEILKAEKVRTGFGTDLLGELRSEQSREFSIRAEVLTPYEIICQATAVNAEILNRSGKLGIIAPGAFADIIAVDGDPLRNIALLEEQGRYIPLVIKDGLVEKDRLN